MIIEGGNDALRLDINVDRNGKPVKVRDHRNPVLISTKLEEFHFDHFERLEYPVLIIGLLKKIIPGIKMTKVI